MTIAKGYQKELLTGCRALLLVLFSLSVPACAEPGQKPMHKERPPVTTVIANHQEQLMATAGVVAVGESLCGKETCIAIYTNAKANADELPKELDGYQVVLRRSAKLTAQ